MRRRPNYFILGVRKLGLYGGRREDKKKRRREKKEEIPVWKLILVSLELLFRTLVWNISFSLEPLFGILVWNSCLEFCFGTLVWNISFV